MVAFLIKSPLESAAAAVVSWWAGRQICMKS